MKRIYRRRNDSQSSTNSVPMEESATIQNSDENQQAPNQNNGEVSFVFD